MRFDVRHPWADVCFLCPQFDNDGRSRTLLVARLTEKPGSSSADEERDEVRDERDLAENARIVVTLTTPDPLQPKTHGRRPDERHHRQNAPAANDDAEPNAEQKPGQPEHNAQPD
jgi:hypothetical protein